MRHALLGFTLLLAVFTVACGGSKAPVSNSAEAKKETDAPKDAKKLSFSGDGSKIEWMASKVTLTHKGGFKTFSGTAALSADGKELTNIEVDIETASIFADNDTLTGHLKSPDFFNVEKYPKAKFVSTEIKAGGADGATHTITGNLSMLEVKKSITFGAKLKIADGKLSGSAKFQINRQDWGLKYPGKPDDLISDLVELELTIEAK